MSHARCWSGDTCDHTHHNVPDWPFPSLRQRAEELRRQDGDGGRDGLPYGIQHAAIDEGRREGQGRSPSYPRLNSPQQPSVRRPFVCPVNSTLAQTE